ncbi:MULTISPECIES: hypothetical protein [Halomonas]|uniref:hypothetical protein n=1 Tax=Halomonas TaxID=2745 RepID=UPI001A8FAD2C|nr:MULTISPECIES: hypothetical protein [Halomonas]MBN8413769.1 hypothetical protein [Halomonas litopenaei]MBY5967783.1 hypothetical protein [Halomonas denitrificans]
MSDVRSDASHHDRNQRRGTSLRHRLALVAGLALAVALLTPLAWLIHHRDWGVLLMPLVPVVIWWTLNAWRYLEQRFPG